VTNFTGVFGLALAIVTSILLTGCEETGGRPKAPGGAGAVTQTADGRTVDDSEFDEINWDGKVVFEGYLFYPNGRNEENRTYYMIPDSIHVSVDTHRNAFDRNGTVRFHITLQNSPEFYAASRRFEAERAAAGKPVAIDGGWNHVKIPNFLMVPVVREAVVGQVFVDLPDSFGQDTFTDELATVSHSLALTENGVDYFLEIENGDRNLAEAFSLGYTFFVDGKTARTAEEIQNDPSPHPKAVKNKMFPFSVSN